MHYTDRGLREMLAGLDEVRDIIEQECRKATEDMAAAEARVARLRKQDAALGLAMEIIAVWNAERQAAERQKEGTAP